MDLSKERKALFAGISLRAILFLVFLACASTSQASGTEEILYFKSVIRVNADSSLDVTETISVQALGENIKHGIFRDIPTQYKDKYGTRIRVDLDVTQVLCNGRPENYVLENISGGIGGPSGLRVKIGNKDKLIPAGVYNYSISYHTTRQISYQENQDALYWNVTGNGWIFPIKRTEAIVYLPKEAKERELEETAYTGRLGETGSRYKISKGSDGSIMFSTTAPLASYEGLTIFVSWPKGVVSQPTEQEKWGYFYRDNLDIIIGILGLLCVIGWYLSAWLAVGKDPERGTIIPLFTPPAGLTPPDIRYLTRMGYDDKAFSATILSLAIKGYVNIEKPGDDYELVFTDKAISGLDTEESAVLQYLKQRSYSGRLKVDQIHYRTFQGAISVLKEALKTEHLRYHFVTNWKYFAAGLGISAIVVLLTLCSLPADMAAAGAFLCVWLTIWTSGVSVLVVKMMSLWWSVMARREVGLFFSAIFLTLFSIPFVAGEIFGIYMLAAMGSVILVIILLVLGILNYWFFHLLKAPTLKGRKLMDSIEGFKMYLLTAEKDTIAGLRMPQKTTELFEKYLPYAVALDVEQKWAEAFSEVLSAAAVEQKMVSNHYSPSWYHGAAFAGVGSFGAAFSSSFSSALASSSASPRSSSSGGGGCSGGGGGGGGGGGW